jgi:hypothetical protein
VKKTPWFKDIEPVRKGVYERKYEWGTNYAYFDGTAWGLVGITVEEAYQWGTKSRARTDGARPWRGMISKGGA